MGLETFNNTSEIPATEETKNEKLISRLKKIAGKLTVYGSLALSAYGAYTPLTEYVAEYARGQQYGTQETKLKYEQLEEEYGRRFFDTFYLASYVGTLDQDEHTDTEKTATSTIEIRGESFTSEEVDQILETYPKGWVHNEVSSIEQRNEDGKLPEQYGLKKDWVTLADCTHNPVDKSQKITLYREASNKDRYYVFTNLLGHESAHANDWESDNEMSPEERLELLLAITDRLNDDDRMISNYVESIINEDKQEERYLKAVEYWAEICSQYFSDPLSLHIKDFQIVDKVVRKSDPEFNTEKQWMDRTNMITPISTSHVNTN